jgi:2-oxoisovalerate dehydrogenase E1 component alpha subunit
VVSEALESARRGGGPTVVEALTYRLSDHTTADDASRYRNEDEVKRAWVTEPLLRLRRFLIDAGRWSGQRETALQARCAAQIETAVAEYLSQAKPSTDAMFDHLFAIEPPHLTAQRTLARSYGSKSSGH